MVIKILFALFLLAMNVDLGNAQVEHDVFLSKTFKKIIKSDQSNIRNNSVRDSLILENFSLIKSLLNDSVNLNTTQELNKRTHKRLNTGLVITFIHVLQIDPHLLLNEETVHLFAEHIDQKRISSKELKSALSVYQIDVENDRWSEESASYFKERVESVKREWNIESLEEKTVSH